MSTLLPSRRKTTSSSESPLMNRTLPASFQSPSPCLMQMSSGISNGLIHNFVYLCNNAADFPSHHSVECQNSSFPNDVDQTRYRNGDSAATITTVRFVIFCLLDFRLRHHQTRSWTRAEIGRRLPRSFVGATRVCSRRSETFKTSGGADPNLAQKLRICGNTASLVIFF